MTDEYERSEMAQIIRELVERGERIERERSGQALTAEEVKTLKAANFLRQVAPYLFQPRKIH